MKHNLLSLKFLMKTMDKTTLFIAVNFLNQNLSHCHGDNIQLIFIQYENNNNTTQTDK